MKVGITRIFYWGGVGVPSSSPTTPTKVPMIKQSSPWGTSDFVRLLTEQWLRVTDRGVGDAKVATLEDLYQAWRVSLVATKIEFPPLVLTSLCTPAPPPGHMQLGQN